MPSLRTVAQILILGVVSLTAQAQSFLVSNTGKTVGSATLSLTQSASGYALTSGVKIDMKDLAYSFTQTSALNSAYGLNNSQLSGLINGTAVTVKTVRSGQQFTMTINANGQVTNQPLAAHPGAILLPDFDPGALTLALRINTPDGLFALIPKQTGMESSLTKTANPDQQGTLNGKPIPVHHYTLNSDAGKIEVFASATNELLQAEWPDQAFALVRQGFVITPPAKAPAPPANLNGTAAPVIPNPR